MLIDDFLPEYDIKEHHQIVVRAPLDSVYRTAYEMDISNATMSQWLFKLRGISAASRFTREDLFKMCFIPLGEIINKEFVFGLVGQFWKPSGNLIRMTTPDYINFHRRGFAKAAWNFSLVEQPDHTVVLSTETRVQCSDAYSRTQFRLYWTIIGVFSGLIRREILKTFKQIAERETVSI